MANLLKFSFVLKEKFNLDNFQNMLKLVAKEEFNDKSIQYKKGIYDYDYYYYYDYQDQKNDIAIAFYWYPQRNKLHFYAPNFSNAPSCCIQLVKVIYQYLKFGGYGFDDWSVNNYEYVDYNEEEITKIRIWAVNLLTPSEVQKYGREKLLKAPCEVIEEWEDGAIFMMIHKDKFSSFYEERKKLREYLGLEQ